MIYFKACRRCGGDLTTNQDYMGAYIFCVQCGDRHEYTPQRYPVWTQERRELQAGI